jgi:3-hydroxyacyl-CoA dehydrogenase/enoyl-CoA hydratase/3-hydroxybutyryl-CoA epimerase/3-hydroxyacyl-CoA dehydrogenase/enoyl-CoA hydratase/3-hydroxybutyryl-CoA epimerase/enoyl-CoA isomerase
MATAFRFEELDGNIGLVTFDLPDKKVNTLSRTNLMELASVVEQLEARTELRGLLFKSGKPGQFIAGADLNDIAALSFITPDQAALMLAFGHQLFSRISRLPFPTVALIDGNCMGGGTELVLSMDDRIVSSAPHTQVALPEVKIGIIPGWGGTQRLPRLIGLNPAIEMITSGESISAQKAVSVGFAFDAVPADSLSAQGIRLIHHLRESGDWTTRREQRRQPLGLNPDELQFAFAVAEGYIKGKTKGQYPAPLVALKAMKEGCNRPLDEGLLAEQKAVRELVGSPILANLIALFFMKNRLTRDTGIDDPTVQPRPVKHVGVVGAGLMGAGIVAAHARSGIPTVLVDVDDARINDGMARAQEVVLSRIKIGRAQPMDLASMLSLINTSTNPSALGDCDVVIEAVTENPAVKKEVYGQLARVLKEGAILASNTSTISITRMAASAPDPSRFIGMHFFNPVDRMELVEVIRGEQTSDDTVATIVALAKQVRKTPIVVRDCAGFLVNRVLFPYMNESLMLLEEGVPAQTIDRVATRFGMPMGPLTLTDLVGLETSVYAGKLLARAYPDRTVSSTILEEMLQAGGGGKSALKFYLTKGKSSKPEPSPAVAEIIAKHHAGEPSTMDDSQIADRLFLPMLLEATRVLEEGIVREPGDVDMGLILGIGFPPFRGGILRWADTEGAAATVDRLERYAHLGKRYEPTESLLRLAHHNESFYPRPKTVAPVPATVGV